MGKSYYSPIAFNERVTFCFQSVLLLPCAGAYVALLYVKVAYIHDAITHVYTIQCSKHTRTEAVTRRVEAEELLSRRRQSNNSWHVC